MDADGPDPAVSTAGTAVVPPLAREGAAVPAQTSPLFGARLASGALCAGS